MSKQLERISRKMHEVGACYAYNTAKHIAPNDPGTMNGDAKPSYHVHGDCTDPQGTKVMRFYSLKEVEGWIDTRIAISSINDPDEADRLMGDFWESIQG